MKKKIFALILSAIVLISIQTFAAEAVIRSNQTITITLTDKDVKEKILSVRIEENGKIIYIGSFENQEITDNSLTVILPQETAEPSAVRIFLNGIEKAENIIPQEIGSGSFSFGAGEMLKLGRYGGRELLWRCIGNDENGSLMLLESSVMQGAFDPGGTDSDEKRAAYGSNEWINSTLSLWLNSEETIVPYNSGNVPDATHVSENPYSNKSGFLSEFNSQELSALKLVQQKQISPYSAGAENLFTFGRYTASQTTEDVYGYISADRIFVPDALQISAAYNALGKEIFKSESFWLRTPVAYKEYNEYVCVIEEDGQIGIQPAYMGNTGIRPAFYMDMQNIADANISFIGNGTVSSPYLLSEEKNFGQYNVKIPEDIHITADFYTKRIHTKVAGGADPNFTAVAVIAFYDEDGKIVSVVKNSVNAGYKSTEAKIPDRFEYAKAFLWDSMQTVIPISESLELINKQGGTNQ